ncbi:c-type cytochrome biogenesis protein CcmI [Thiopseudomonas denitrificans]
MITFWLLALVLLVSAMLLMLWPVLNVRKLQAEEDRTALNVALYQERLNELQGQFDQGTLSKELFEEGRLEAERELLEDTAQGAPQQKARLGIALPLIATLLLPVAGAGLYMVWGAGDQVAMTLEQVP